MDKERVRKREGAQKRERLCKNGAERKGRLRRGGVVAGDL
jgi:hypothetical protein